MRYNNIRAISAKNVLGGVALECEMKIMKYDFDQPINRLNTNSLKWDIHENELPMWVADMDFKACPAIINAIKERTDNGVFGYSVVPDKWYEAYSNHWKKRYGFKMTPDSLVFCTGVIPALSSIVRKFTTPAENVCIQTPVYNIFYNCILNNGRNVIENPLKYADGQYSQDFADLEKKLANPQTTLMLLCNPQNPSGKIWSRTDLAEIGKLCKKYHVLVVSDEIHCDLTDPNKNYVPFASVNSDCAENSITCIAPSKAFNIAGLNTAAIMASNSFIRHKAQRGLNTDECAEPNVFACQTAIAAFNEGDEWLDELRDYIYKNKLIVKDFIEKNIPQIKLVDSEATYLLWLDCSSLKINAEEFQSFLRKSTGLWLSAGDIYGGNGNSFMRMNIACPKAYIYDGLERLKNGVFAALQRE